MRLSICTIGLAWGLTLPVHAQSLEVIQGAGFVQRGRVTRPAQAGGQLKQGDRVSTTSGSLDVLLDYSAGTIQLQPQTTADLILIARKRGCLREQISFLGRLRVKIKPFLCSTSLLQLISPQGLWEYRGTSGYCGSSEDSSFCAVEHGRIVATAQGKSVSISTGYASRIYPGEPPTRPQRLDSDQELKAFRWEGDRVEGQINPFNALEINDQPVPVASDGTFSARVGRVVVSNSLRVVVRSPFGEGRTHLRDRRLHPF